MLLELLLLVVQLLPLGRYRSSNRGLVVPLLHLRLPLLVLLQPLLVLLQLLLLE